MSYNDIIKKQMASLPQSIKWWPKYFYHFTNIENAIGIIDKGWIYGRQEAVNSNLMETDNASPSVISVSQKRIREYARLYFRPRTPTQYNNEGYKPEHIRKADINANCPVPIFFFLDSNTILNIDGVKFSETSCAGQKDLNLLSGEDEFGKLPFEKIYHDKAFSPEERDDIVKHRHAEIVRLDGIPIKDAIKGIVCRSVAEKQTLVYLLKTQYPKEYEIYQPIIRYSPELNLFFNNGIYIKTVNYMYGRISIELNDYFKRDKRERSKGDDFALKATVQYVDENDMIIDREQFDMMINYAQITQINLSDLSAKAYKAIVEIYFDENLMYKNMLIMSTEDLL